MSRFGSCIIGRSSGLDNLCFITKRIYRKTPIAYNLLIKVFVKSQMVIMQVVNYSEKVDVILKI